MSNPRVSLIDFAFMCCDETIKDEEYISKEKYQTRDINGELRFFSNFNDAMKHVETIEINNIGNIVVKISFPDDKSKSRIRLLRCNDNRWYNEPFTCGMINGAMDRENKTYNDLNDVQKEQYNKLFNNELIKHWTVAELYERFG